MGDKTDVTTGEDSLIEGAETLQEVLDLNELQAFAQELTGIYGEYKKDPRKMNHKLDEFQAELNQSLNYQVSPDQYLIVLYREAIGALLSKAVEYLNSGIFQEVLAILENHANSNQDLSPELKEKIDLHVYELCDLFATISLLGFDRQPTEYGKKFPLKKPFDKIEITTPGWERNFEAGENFAHAISNMFNIVGYAANIESVMDKVELDEWRMVFSDLKTQVFKQLPYLIPFLEACRNKVLDQDKRESVDVETLGNQVVGALKARCAFEFDRREIEHDPAEKLPVKFDLKTRGLMIENAAGRELYQALFEIGKNAVARRDKVTPQQLKGYIDRGEAYMTITAGEVTINGEQAIAFEFSDKGSLIDIPGVVAKMGDLTGWESRDINVADMLDTLSVRRVSIPMRGATDENRGKAMFTGIGLHSARTIIREHGGDIFPVNRPDGVSFLVVIPKNGKASKWKVSEEHLKGAQCREISEKIASAQAELRAAIQEALKARGITAQLTQHGRKRITSRPVSREFQMATSG